MKLLISGLILLSVIYSVSSVVFTSSVIKHLANGTCGISTGAPLVQQLTATVTYAGGLFWADDGAKIAYIDRYVPAYGRYTPNNGRFNHMSIDGGKETIAIFPIKNATGLKFVIGLDRRLVLSVVTGTGNSLNSTIYPLITVSNKTNEKFMKGKIDANGRLWYSSSDGLLNNKANRRIVFEKCNHTELAGKPFDIVLDSSGYIWIGLLHGGAVIQYDEVTGNILWIIAIPASDIISLEFGGLDKKTMYVGTSKQYLHNTAAQPAAGSILSVSGLGYNGICDNDIVIPDKYSNL
ncbi:Senescence marker protein-30 [Carabus blaptoides fortunei]